VGSLPHRSIDVHFKELHVHDGRKAGAGCPSSLVLLTSVPVCGTSDDEGTVSKRRAAELHELRRPAEEGERSID
jgi:hypothetical protein